MKRDMHYELMKRGEMHFIYAAFYAHRDLVFVKVGRSVTPYKRVLSVSQGCPLELSQAAFVHAGGIEVASSIERSVFALLGGYRTRGEWYCFEKSDGSIFRSTIASAFAKCTGRELRWTPIDVAAMRREMAEAALKFQRRRGGPKTVDT